MLSSCDTARQMEMLLRSTKRMSSRDGDEDYRDDRKMIVIRGLLCCKYVTLPFAVMIGSQQ